jgi:hypothetical protein
LSAALKGIEMEKIVKGLAFAVLVTTIVLGAFWLLWLLWCWVLPQIWIDGPKNIVAPGYWLFAACWCLVSWIGKAIFGRGSDK